jgi:CRP-like cAMP-binding protein
MIDVLINYFERHIPLNEAEKEMVRREVPVQAFPKNYLLLKQGNVSKAFYFVIKGTIRLFYSTGLTEKTGFFYTENMFVSSYESFTRQVPSKHNFQALEASTLAIFTPEAIRKLLAISTKFDLLARIMMEEELAVCQSIISSFVTLNAEQRYLQFLQEQPQLVQRIPQHQIASFIGVSAETLSRIRKRISNK